MSPEAGQAEWHGSRVLVVEDDPPIRQFLRDCLEIVMDCRVTTAADASEALACLHSSAFDLVLTDMHMPGITGLELIARLRILYPDVPAVLITGSLDQPARTTGALLLVKPVTVDTLCATVRTALGHTAAHGAGR
jgi:two-component system C4-dicarboxylate transport response regulator DctD